MGTHPIFESDFDCLTEENITMNSELERLLPELSGFKYKIKNPAKTDLQIDLVECVLNRLIWTEKTGEVSLKRATEVLNDYFLLYSQEEKKLAQFRYLLYTEIAERIGEAIRANHHGIVNSLVVCYAVFDSTPFFVDEGIIANVVNAVKELQFVDPWTIAYVDGMSKKSRRKKGYKSFIDGQCERLPITLVEECEDYCSSVQNKYADRRSEGRNENSLSPNSSRYSDEESEYSCQSVI